MKKFIDLRVLIIVIVLALFFGLSKMNQSLSQRIDHVVQEKSMEQVEQQKQSQASEEKRVVLKGQKVTRKTRRDPRGGSFLESTFFSDGEVIARYKQSKGEIYDREGSIPDGKVEFLNESTKIRGEEYYQDGKRHGAYKEFYKTGELKREVQYYRGKVISSKEYYLNGDIRLEQEFKNALWDAFDLDHYKQGSGRLYFPDGAIEREWDYEGEEGERYLRFYDKNGQLVKVEYYDEAGNLIENK